MLGLSFKVEIVFIVKKQYYTPYTQKEMVLTVSRRSSAQYVSLNVLPLFCSCP